MKNRSVVLKSLTALAVSALPVAAALADPSPALDRFSLSVGAFDARSDASIGLKATDGSFATDRFQIFNGDDTIPRVKLDVLLGDHQGLAFDYYRYNRSRTRSASQPYSYNGTDYTLDASVGGDATLKVGSATYRWWLGSGSDVLGLGIGAAYYDLDVGVQGTATSMGQTVSASDSYSDHATAPQLTLGWRHQLTDSVRLYADAAGVRKSGGNLSGHIYSGALGVEWFPWRNVGFGAEYGVQRIHLDKERSGYEADLDIRLDGPSAFLRARF